MEFLQSRKMGLQNFFACFRPQNGPRRPSRQPQKIAFTNLLNLCPGLLRNRTNLAMARFKRFLEKQHNPLSERTPAPLKGFIFWHLSARPLERPLEVKLRGVEVPKNGSIPGKSNDLTK